MNVVCAHLIDCAQSLPPPLHKGDLFLGQPIQLVHQRVDLLVGGLDLAMLELLVGGNGGLGQRLVEVQHALHKGDHKSKTVMPNQTWYTTFPPTMVRATLSLRMSSVATVYGSSCHTIRSANLPGSQIYP